MIMPYAHAMTVNKTDMIMHILQSSRSSLNCLYLKYEKKTYL